MFGEKIVDQRGRRGGAPGGFQRALRAFPAGILLLAQIDDIGRSQRCAVFFVEAFADEGFEFGECAAEDRDIVLELGLDPLDELGSWR